MTVAQLVKILELSRLSPEQLAPRLGVSNMTYRRILKSPAQAQVPKKYENTIREGIYKLISEGLLDVQAKPVSEYLAESTPQFFQAAVHNLGVAEEFLSLASPHEDQVTLGLFRIGGQASKQKEVNDSVTKIKAFEKFGSEWKKRVKTLVKVIRSSELSMVDKLVAYGALFYLITPFDLIPDHIPVIGYIDDFAILGFAMAFYLKKFPKLRLSS